MSDCTKVRVSGAKSFLIIFLVILVVWMLASWLAQVIIMKKTVGSTGEGTARKIAQMFFSFPSPAFAKYSATAEVPKTAPIASLILGLGICIGCGFAASAGGVPHGGPKGWKCSQGA